MASMTLNTGGFWHRVHDVPDRSRSNLENSLAPNTFTTRVSEKDLYVCVSHGQTREPSASRLAERGPTIRTRGRYETIPAPRAAGGGRGLGGFSREMWRTYLYLIGGRTSCACGVGRGHDGGARVAPACPSPVPSRKRTVCATPNRARTRPEIS